MKSIIIDDEPLAHSIIKSYCEKLETIEIKASFHSALDALPWLNENTVDLIFLDINMPVLKGLDFLKTLNNKPLVIITSAYQEYALESYDLDVVDYLLKPFDFNRFIKAVNRAFAYKQLQKGSETIATAQTTDTSESIFVKSDKKLHQVQLAGILYLESAGSYVKIHMANKTIMVLNRLAYFEKSLNSKQFVRVHKSFIVSIGKIDLIEGNQVQIGERKIPIGQTYKNNLSQLYH
ncbi:response regulator transcription factor [Fulvivirga sp. RKSG066]|uniref:LytR/AlgR family response regulator transcription factor n=1 Tax=Fulvivirga aurantia TaxID=2529383 RepID=UPI0012BC499C|nr:LytTR family DNA-binding domain-containing protein [Fulvivirga aurantia]MTI21684.1 response regulator transcription factor [Fulvivirga aurantia]